MYRPTASSYFSGAGGMDIGMMQAGVNIVQSLDLDKDAIAAMKANPKYFSHNILHQDITNITVLEQEKTDIIIGTYPCTKYSAIADIHGTRTGDDLFLHFFRHIAIGQPEMYIVENVPGMKKFKVVMEAMTKLPDYYVSVFCPVNASNWLPQERKRLILIGTRKPFDIRQPGKACKIPSIKDILEENPKVDLPEYIYTRIKGVWRDKPIVVREDGIAPTCVAHYSKDLSTRMVSDERYPYGLRPFSIREYARLQGFPDDYVFADARSSYRLIGNAVAIDMARWCGNEAVRYFN